MDSLTDRDEIRNVIMRYAVGLDRRDFAMVAACFTAEARATYNGNKLEPGVERIIEHIRGLENMPASQHVFGSSLIDVDDDRATSTSYAVAYLIRASGTGHEVTSRGLVYDDEWIRTPDGWRIDVRVHGPIWSVKGPVEFPVGPVN